MNQLMSFILIITGLVLFFAPEYILQDPKTTQNEYLKFMYDYHYIIASGCGLLAYYFYVIDETDPSIDSIYESGSGSGQVSSKSSTSSKFTQ